jgi:hypothetical protein
MQTPRFPPKVGVRIISAINFNDALSQWRGTGPTLFPPALRSGGTPHFQRLIPLSATLDAEQSVP